MTAELARASCRNARIAAREIIFEPICFGPAFSREMDSRARRCGIASVSAPAPHGAPSCAAHHRAKNRAAQRSSGRESLLRAPKIAVIHRGMMNTNLIALATELTDHDLLARITALAAKERGPR
jgi:hypothetical protein